jgi:hypothetical protein
MYCGYARAKKQQQTTHSTPPLRTPGAGPMATRRGCVSTHPRERVCGDGSKEKKPGDGSVLREVGKGVRAAVLSENASYNKIKIQCNPDWWVWPPNWTAWCGIQQLPCAGSLTKCMSCSISCRLAAKRALQLKYPYQCQGLFFAIRQSEGIPRFYCATRRLTKKVSSKEVWWSDQLSSPLLLHL